MSHRILRSLAFLSLAAVLACKPEADPAQPVATPAAPDAKVWSLDPSMDAMTADIGWLADDARKGRFTLSPELMESATWIAAQQAEAGLVPLPGQDDMLVEFPIYTGAKLEGEQLLEVGKKKQKALPADAFRPLPMSPDGELSGEVVFAGYAAFAAPVEEDPETDEQEGRPGYDDLAGLDVKGKIALVLMDGPATPDFRALMQRIPEILADFEKKAAPLLEAKDVDGMKKLHVETRARLAEVVRPFMRGADLPKEFLEAPADEGLLMVESLGMQEVFAPLMRAVGEMKGPTFDPRSLGVTRKVERLAEAGATGIIFVRGPRSFIDEESRKADALPELESDELRTIDLLPIPAVQVSWKQADKVLKVGNKKLSAVQKQLDESMTPASGPTGLSAHLKVDLAPIAAEVPNVIAMLPGTESPDEWVVIGAHYDHIGTAELGDCQARSRKGVEDAICNGADDNASGSAMVMEIARSVQRAGLEPKRSLVFVHFSGEELGLYGSRTLASSQVMPADKVVAMVNLDMVGRYGAHGLDIGGVETGDSWMKLLDEVGNNELSVTYDAGISDRSVHGPYHAQKIPVLFFFIGVHADYHRPGDHLDKIKPEGMLHIAQLVGEVVVRLADGYAIEYVPPTPEQMLGGGLPGSNEGTIVKRVEGTL